MGWSFGRSRGARALDARTAQRLERLARQWRPVASDGPRSGWQPARDDPATAAGTADQWSAEGDVPPSRRGMVTRPWNRSATRALVLLLAGCLSVTAWWWWSGRPHEQVAAPVILATGVPLVSPPDVAPDDGTQAGASVEPDVVDELAVVVVHVTGQVVRPGLVTLPAGSRVADALAAAGGVTRKRAAESVNLARILLDGEQIVVGQSGGTGSGSSASSTAPGGAPAPLELNRADGAALEGLPGVGPVLAGRILQWRLDNGPFRSVDELGEVSGIGDATLARLRSLVRV